MPDDVAALFVADGAPPFVGSGRGVRVAVIDSGVYPTHSHIGAIAGGVAISPEGLVVADDEAWLDRLGHGTAVTAAIQEKAPEAECFAVKVFHAALRTTGATLIRAIDWCVDQRMDLVNLSLGSTNPDHLPSFAFAADRARQAGVVLVAAREAGGQACYPGALPSVVSVGVDWDCPRHRYRRVAGTQSFEASGFPRPVPGVPPVRNLYGISFAVANMSGIIARALETEGGDRDAGRADRVGRALLRELDREDSRNPMIEV